MGIQSMPVEIDGMKFTIQQFNFQQCINLETQTLTILAPGLDLLENFKGMDEELDIGELGSVLKKILFGLREENPFEYIKVMVQNTFYTENTNIQLNTNEAINKVFHGKTITCMKLLFEIMKVNKFAFIEGLVGSGLNLTDIFQNTKENQKKETLELGN